MPSDSFRSPAHSDYKADGLAVDATGERDLGLPDPGDEPFLGVALAGQVDYLVTRNLPE